MLSNQYPNYSSPPGGRTSDHSLMAEPRLYASSPNSQSLYELDFPLSSSLSSSCGAETVADLSDLSDFDLKPQFESNINDFGLLNLDSNDPTWSPGAPTDIDTNLIKMENAFQVDQTDAMQCPTLAELNGDDSTSIFGDIESIIGKDMAASSPVMLAAQGMASGTCHWKPAPTQTPSMPIPITRSRPQQSNALVTCTVTSPTNHVSEVLSQSLPPKLLPPALYTQIGKLASLPEHSKIRLQGGMTQMARSAPTTFDTSSLHQLLTEGQIKQEEPGSPVSPQRCHIPVPNMSVQTVPPSPVATVPQVSSPIKMVTQNSSMDEKWEEIKQFIYDSENNSLPTPTNVSPSPKVVPKVEQTPDVAFTMSEEQPDADSNDDDSDSDENMSISDQQDIGYDENFWSDNESLDDFSEEVGAGNKKSTRFFWQYNTQSKGPKGKRLCKSFENADPHVLNDFEDPVFDPELNQLQYKHNGKARRGDGNDITPSPQKLLAIGKELKTLNRIINDLTPVSELPVTVRPRSRKEKNKLASRACRLKKKAQHEANKVKLHGLDKEHQRLMTVLDSIKPHLLNRYDNADPGEPMSIKLDRYIKKYLTHMIAGHTTEYVNSVLAKVRGGNLSGGIYD